MRISARFALGVLLACVANAACDANDAANSDGTAGMNAGGRPNEAAARPLKAAYAEYFTIGAAVAPWHLANTAEILTTQFNRLTAENAMKTGVIHPGEATFDSAEADQIADFAREHGMKLTGHTLLWHRQQPAWLFAGLTASDPQSIETLKSRLKAHIEWMVERYADVVDNWDVVNEAISDGSNTYRDAAEGSQWFQYFGSEEYVYWAFVYARDALEAREAGSSAGKLYYNDYNVTLKVDKILILAEWLKSRGITIDGIGDQAHVRVDWPPVSDFQAAYSKIVAAGYKVKVSELDVSLYNDYPGGVFTPAPEVPFTPALEARQAARYAELFQFFRSRAADITSVTFWGVSDDRTWLDNEPVAGRNDHPLLYDDARRPKAALKAIADF